MKLTELGWFGAGGRREVWLSVMCVVCACLAAIGWSRVASAQSVSTTTVQGTVYLANGQPGGGTVNVSWPAFTTANGLAVAADSTTATMAADGFLSVNLAPNLGATPAGLYYTAVYYLSDGTSSTQYWVVPAAAMASLAQVQSQLMPAVQAVQTVSKAYVDESIAEVTGSLLTGSGGTLSGPLYLSADPTQPLQAATKHYVDATFSEAVPLAGGNMTGGLQTPSVNGVQSPLAATSQTALQAAINAAGASGAMQIPPAYAGADTFTNPNGLYVKDLRTGVAQQSERSVKEFGAVCDGVTDDTSALQAALNYANAHGVALTIPQGTCKTHTLNWHGESIGGLGKQVSSLMGFPGQDVLASAADSASLLSYTRLHDVTIFVDQSVDVSCSSAKGRASAGSCALNRPMESNSIFSPGGNGLTGTLGTGAGWAVGNCAIAMAAVTGAGGNGLKVAELENVEIATTGTDPMAAQYPGAHSTHTCGLYLAQWPQWSEFRNIDIRGLNTGVAIPTLPGTTPAGLCADSNRWQDVTIQATHAFTAAAGSSNVLDNVIAPVGNSSATAEPPTGLVLDFAGTQNGWTVRNAVVQPAWTAVQPTLTVTAAGGAVTGVALGAEHGLGFDPYGTLVPLAFSGSCTAQATATVNAAGSIGSVSVTAGGVGCSGTTTASVNAAGTWDTAAPVNLVGGQNMTLFAGNLLKGNGGYTVWNAKGSQSNGAQLGGGGGNLPGGGTYAALVANNLLGAAIQVEQMAGADFGAKVQACLGTLSATFGGVCDARNFTGNQSMGSNLTISTANATVLLPCATISTAKQVIVTAGTRNVSLRGCALRGGSPASGSQGGTAFAYSGTGAMVQVGDPTYAADTPGFHMDNVVVNTTGASSAAAQGLVAYRTQEMDLESLYFLGNANQTGATVDGTGNYAGGTFFDDEFSGFQTAVNAIGHQVTNPATTDWMNASTFVRLHIDCPTSGGSPIAGTTGINLQQGDGNTFNGGDVEGCATALHLGANAQNNTIVGLRNENSTSQVVADAGSQYNNWMTGGTMFTGALTDNGTRNSFLDSFHRSFNGIKGDWYGSQQDATVTNHWRLGIGTGNERGLLNEIQTDYGYRWLEGYSDAAAGEQFYQIEDLLNSVNRVSIGQYNNGQPSTNNQTVINAAGTGAVVLNGSTNSGTGGVVVGSGGATETTVATVSNAGNAQFNGTLLVGGTSQSTGTLTVRNNADAEVDYYLWPGATASQKGAFTYKDWNGNSQWYLVKDASNNWSLNSATGGLDSFKAYQSTNSGDTYVNASNASGVVRVNYETGAGTGFNIYGGSSSLLYASFTAANAIKFPGLAAGSGHFCLQVDNSGFITNTGATCGTGDTNGTVDVGTSGQIAYYDGSGTAVGGVSEVPLAAGGTGASTATGALANLGGAALAGATFTGPVNAPIMEGQLQADQMQSPAGTGNNGIAQSLTQCASQSYSCSIVAPALYAQTESQPWGGVAGSFWANPATGPTAGQPAAMVFDQRYGVPQWFISGSSPIPGAQSGRFNMPPAIAMSSITAPQGVNGAITPALLLQNSAYAGGRNTPNNGTGGINGDKSNLSTLNINSWKFTQTQNSGDIAQSENCLGNGDCVGHDIETISYGGPSTIADEGNESMRYMAYEQGVVFGATLASKTAASDGSETLATSAQVNNQTQGEDRLVIDLSQDYNAGYVTSIAPTGGNLTVSCTGCNWSGINGNSTQTGLTTAVTNPPGNTNSFPQSNVVLQVSSSAGFTAGNLACVYDYNYECEKITAVGSVTITIATARGPHPVGAYVVTGGLTGYAWEAEADRVIPGNTNGVAQPIDSNLASTVRDAIPIMTSNGNTLTLLAGYNQLPGTGSPGYAGRAYATMGSGGAVSLTIAGGVVTGCTASGGSGYGGSNAPPQVTIAGSWTTAPVVTAWGNGALGGCKVVSGGVGITGTPTAAVLPKNAYDIYPSAKVYGVYDATAGKVDGTLYTEPLAGTFALSDSLEEPHWFMQKTNGGTNGVGQYIPAQAFEPHYGLSYGLNGIWENSDFALQFANGNDPTIYQSYPTSNPWVVGRGQLLPPQGMLLTGPFATGLAMSTPPFSSGEYNFLGSGVNVVHCGNVPCSSWTSGYNLFNLSNGLGGAQAGQDVFNYNPATQVTAITAGATTPNGGGPAQTLSFGPNGLAVSGLGSSTSPVCPNGTNGALTTSGCAGGSGNTYPVLNAATYAGADFSIKVNACLAAAAAGGGGTCDARGFSNAQTASQSITVGDGTHRVVLILPIGTITFASGTQLIYRQFATILGQGYQTGGSMLMCAEPNLVSCVQSYNEPAGQLYGAFLSNFYIATNASSAQVVSGSAGLAVGGVGNADVLESRFEKLNIGNGYFDSGTLVGGAYGCTCYDVFDQVYSNGWSYGVNVANFSSYAGDANSNTWLGGTQTGHMVGIHANGGKNTFFHPDVEGATSHSVDLEGYGNSVIAPYFEADGCTIVAGDDQYIEGPLAYGGGTFSQCYAAGTMLTAVAKTAGTGYVVGDVVTFTGSGSSGSATGTVAAVNGSGGVTALTVAPAGSGYLPTYVYAATGGTGSGLTATATAESSDSFVWGPDAAPNSIGVGSGVYFGAYSQNGGLSSLQANAYPGVVDLNCTGNTVSIYGHNGHCPLNVGELTTTSGQANQGRQTLTALAYAGAGTAVPSPAGSTSYTYYLVGYDRNGGETLPSAGVTISNGPATLGAVLTATPYAAGAGYVVGDSVTLSGNGSDGTAAATVTTVASGGVVTGLSVTTPGSKYAGQAAGGGSNVFAASGGTGTGLSVNVTSSYVTITPPAEDGIFCVDVLKGDTAHLLPNSASVPFGCSNYSALPFRYDYGQATSAFTPAGRNSTADMLIAGNVNAAQFGVGSNVVIPATVSGYQGSSGTKVQLGVGTTTGGHCANFAADGSIQDAGAACGSGSASFSGLSGGTNTGAAMVVGSGASLAATGTGSVTATAMPASGITGAALPAGLTGSSLTGVGTVTGGTWNATPIANAYLANASITVAGQTCTLGSSCAIAAANLSNGVSGTGAAALVNGPTFTGNTTTLANASANSDYLAIQAGTGGTDQIGAVEFANSAGASQWEIRKDATNTFRIRDSANSVDRMIQYAAGQTEINSGGAASVAVNNTSSSGTGGLVVYEGGTNFNTAAFSVNSSGNASITGTTTMGGHLNQSAAGKVGGSCTMSAGTSCTVTLGASFTTPLCVATVQGTTPIAAACSISGTTVTVTAASSNSATWAVFFFGNPN